MDYQLEHQIHLPSFAGELSDLLFRSDTAQAVLVYLPADCKTEFANSEFKIISPSSPSVYQKNEKWDLEWDFISCCNYKIAFYPKYDKENPIHSDTLEVNSLSLTETDIESFNLETGTQYWFEVKASFDDSTKSDIKLFSFRK